MFVKAPDVTYFFWRRKVPFERIKRELPTGKGGGGSGACSSRKFLKKNTQKRWRQQDFQLLIIANLFFLAFQKCHCIIMLISFLICYFSLGEISFYIATLKFEKKNKVYVCT